MSITDVKAGLGAGKAGIPLFPKADASTLVTLLAAGFAATLVWEIWANYLTPLWIGGPLQPAGLVKSAFGISSDFWAQFIHFLTGFVAYPLGYLLVALPVARGLPIRFPWPVIGFGYGVGLWVFAMYGMAHLVAGFPPFLGFGNLAWASLVGHVLFGLAVAAVFAGRKA